MTEQLQGSNAEMSIPHINQQDGIDPDDLLKAFCNTVRNKERLRGCLCDPLAMRVMQDPKDRAFIVITDHSPTCIAYMATRTNGHRP